MVIIEVFPSANTPYVTSKLEVAFPLELILPLLLPEIYLTNLPFVNESKS
jgi:hypothetical protein